MELTTVVKLLLVITVFSHLVSSALQQSVQIHPSISAVKEHDDSAPKTGQDYVIVDEGKAVVVEAVSRARAAGGGGGVGQVRGGGSGVGTRRNHGHKNARRGWVYVVLLLLALLGLLAPFL